MHDHVVPIVSGQRRVPDAEGRGGEGGDGAAHELHSLGAARDAGSGADQSCVDGSF